jgi:hypothetical protein
MKVKQKIEMAHSTCARLNPHFSRAQARDWVYFQVFGAYNGSEKDRRNLALCL